jgi:hypothetical protein
MLLIQYIYEYNTASLIDILYINGSSLSNTNKEKNGALIVLHMTITFSIGSTQERVLIHCFCTIKTGDLLSLSLSFTHFIMIHKKHTSLLLFKIGKDILKQGKTDTFESIY